MDERGVVVTEETRKQVDGGDLIDALEIDRSEIEWRKSFVRLDEADEARMRDLEPTFDAVADDIVDEFYDHLTSDLDATEILGRSSKGLDRLKTDQRAYLRSLTEGEYGRGYFARRARVGKIHEMLGLGPKFYIGAYSVYYEGLVDAIGEAVKAEFSADEAEATADGDSTQSNRRRRGFFARLFGRKAVTNAERSTDAVTSDDAEHEATDDAEYGATDDTTENAPGDVDAAVDAVVERTTSLLKVLALDQQIAMDTYVHAYSEEARQEAERRDLLAREVERDLREPIDDVSAASSVVTERSAAIRDIADEQAQDMEDVAAEISQMSATVEEIAATADQVEDTSDEAVSRARSGEEAADQAIEVMEEVADAAIDVSADLEQLQAQIDEIDAVIEAIDDIAEQTNLLALNASIEAARAGQAGDGFAVVADEVKQLAEQSRERAGDVEKTVDRVQDGAADTIASLSETTDKLHEGIDRGEDAMDSLEEIVDAVERTTEGITEVAVATDEQAVSAEEVTAMVETTRERADDVADRVDDVAEASREQSQRMDAIQRAADRLTGSGAADDVAASDDTREPVTESVAAERAIAETAGGTIERPATETPTAAGDREGLSNGEFAFVGTDGGFESAEPTDRSDRSTK